MSLPRYKYIQPDTVTICHCFTRCVRRAFLCGFDPVTGRDFSHRKGWIVDRLRELGGIFAIDVIAFAVLVNHYHAILRTRPDLVAAWSDAEVATRWLTLFPARDLFTGKAIPPTRKEIASLARRPARIAVLRKRLSSLSWFMAQLNEHIARAANKEDGVTGRFWESRFKCLALLDESAIAACMAYVDLNPLRAGLAATPEDSDFTSIQLRLRAWRQAHMPAPGPDALPDPPHAEPRPRAEDPSAWLCPIQSVAGRRGVLQMTETDYFELVDRTGRILKSGKRGAIDPDLAPILRRIGAHPDAWIKTVSGFGSSFHLAAGLMSSLRNYAELLGRRWFVGLSAARAAFESKPQTA